MQRSVEGDALSSSGEQQSARRSPDRRESTTGILRLDFSKPRRSSGSSVEFRSPPGRTGSNGFNIMARYCTCLSVRFGILTDGRTDGRYGDSNCVRSAQGVHTVRACAAHTELLERFRLNLAVQAYRFLVGKPEGKRSLGRPRRGWVDNIRTDLQEVRCGYMDWIGLAQDRDRWRTFVSAVMNLGVP